MNKSFIRIIILFFLGIGTLCAQTPNQGAISDAETGKPVARAQIKIYGPKNLVLHTDAGGAYRLDLLPAGRYTLLVSAPGYNAKQVELVGTGKPLTLPVIALSKLSEHWTDDFKDQAVVSETIEEESSATEQNPMLSSSQDPFVSAASYTFSPARFRMRGYDSQYAPMYLNGVEMNDMNTGYGVWSLWGGLNDVVRNQETSVGIKPLFSAFGNVGGASNIITRAGHQRKQIRLTYSNSNRTYSNRAMLTYSTGMQNNGWAVTAALSSRWGNGQYSYMDGVFYKAFAYFLGIEKQLSPKHSLALNIIGSPTERGVASATTQEAYDLVGSNFYNPNIGYQSGKIRNARVRKNHEPIIQLSHFWDINERTRFNSTAGVRFGRNGYSALTWFNAPDPRPDYYRHLPSYYTTMAAEKYQDPEAADYQAELWRTDPNVSHINWGKLYEINRNNRMDTYDAHGNLLASGLRSEYAIEDRRNDQLQFNYASTLNTEFTERIKLDAGITYRWNKTHSFSVMEDLLGGEYWYDIDKFAERDFSTDPSKAQQDLRNPDRIVHKGDKFGNDFSNYTQKGGAWLVTRFDTGRFNSYLGMSLGMTAMRRHGNQMRGLFPDNSYGYSKWLKFTDYGVKAGTLFQINGHHFLEFNAALMRQAPYFSNVFVSPRTRNTFVENPRGEDLYSVDMSYQMRLPWLRGRLTGFYTRINNQTRNIGFYDDLNRAFSNYTLSNIDVDYAGIELGLEAKLSTTLTATGALNLGSYRYASDADYLQTVDNSAKLVDSGVVYWQGLNISGTPQTAASMGLTYRAPWYGMFGVNVNYFDRNFISMNPVLRTARARIEMENKYSIPEKLKGGFTVDLFAGYSYRIANGKYLRFNLSVSNVLNNRNLHSGGFEQLRVRIENGKYARPFDSKYYYMYGTNFFFNTSLQF